MILPDVFLAPSHSAIPCQLLQIKLTNIYFPNLPQLLLSSRNIISLSLRFDRAVITNFLLPEVITTALSAAFQLEKLSLCFHDEVEGEQLTVPLLSKSPVLLSSLNEFCFNGLGDYLEAFVSRIHMPVLEQLDVTLWWPHIADFPQLSLRLPDRAAERIASPDFHHTWRGRLSNLTLFQTPALSQVNCQSSGICSPGPASVPGTSRLPTAISVHVQCGAALNRCRLFTNKVSRRVKACIMAANV